MKTLAEVADALREVVATTGLRTYDTLPATVNPPAAVITLGEIDYLPIYETGFDVPFDVYVFTSGAVERVAQGALYDYASATGPSSIPRAVENEPTLGLAGVSATCESYRPLALEEVAAYQYWGGVFRVQVLVS